MILSGHIIDYDNLQFRADDDNLLNFINIFTFIDPTNMKRDCGGNYVFVNTTRSIVIRSEATEVGFIRRSKENDAASLLKNNRNRTNKFHSSYSSRKFSNQ